MAADCEDLLMREGERIQVGTMSMVWGEQLQEMKDSSDLLGDVDALRFALARDGYVLLKGVLSCADVLAARLVVLSSLDVEWGSVDLAKGELMDGWIREGCKGVLLTGFRNVTHHEHTLRLLHSRRVSGLFDRVFGSTPATFDNKWVRVHGHGEFTDEHTDYYRFASIAKNMFTCWIPLGDYTPKEGTLAVLPGSHLIAYREGLEFKQELPLDFAEHCGGIWRTACFQKGDLVIFDIRTIHASTQNQSQRFRISMDTRWQPARDVQNHTLFHVLNPREESFEKMVPS